MAINVIPGTIDLTMRIPFVFFLMALMMVVVSPAWSKGTGSSAGLTLLEPFGARAASLGQSFSAVKDDVSGFGYNPASLDTLKFGQAGFMYQKGMAEDSYGQFIIGSPTKRGGAGLSLGYYHGGELNLIRGGVSRTVVAQKDLTVALAYARKVGPTSLGMTGKWISSELAETVKATAYAADLGIQVPFGQRLNMGAAVQNLGTQLKYVRSGDNLPRIARLGASYLLLPGRRSTTFSIEAPYFLNEQELRPSLGVETLVGPLAFRGGYRTGAGAAELTLGTGFILGGCNLDYSFALADQLSSTHRVSMSMRFADPGISKSAIVSAPVSEKKSATIRAISEVATFSTKSSPQRQVIISDAPFLNPQRKVYIIQPGDTLGKIAHKIYGDSREWERIYAANRHLLQSSGDMTVGKKILLP